MASSTLYDHPNVYTEVFAPGGEEAAFFGSLLPAGPRPAWVLDVGAGSGELGRLLRGAAGAAILSLDLHPLLVRSAPRPALRGDLLHLPCRGGSIDRAFSRLFAYGYALGHQPGAAAAAAGELHRVLKPGGRIAIELPVAHAPKALQGLSESAGLAPGLHYRFDYNELTAPHPFGAVLQSRITVERSGSVYTEESPLLVFTPAGARAWLAGAGFTAVAFHAPYDLATRTDEPPPDCLRAVITAEKPGATS